LAVGAPCPCCGAPLIDAEIVAVRCNVTTRRVFLASQSPSHDPVLPSIGRGLAGERLWCPTKVSRWADPDADPVPPVANTKNPWSKKATAYATDAAGNEVGWEQSFKIQVRWRHNGVGRKQTFSGDGHRAEAQRLIDNVALAHRDCWTGHDDMFRPVPPPTATTATRQAPATVDVPPHPASSLPADHDDSIGTKPARSVSTYGLYDPARTVAAAVTIRQNQIMDMDLEPSDKQNRLSALEFIKRFLVYPEGHPQLARLGIPAGSSFLFDDEVGLGPQDLSWFVQVRRTTDLRALAQYERRVAKWEEACERIRRKAADRGEQPILPERPILEPMCVKQRTESFTWQAVEGVVALALEYRWITFNPYTKSVRDQVRRVDRGAEVDSREVATQDEVTELVRAMSQHTVLMRNMKTWRYEEISGDRYSLFIEVRGRFSLRIEEAVALFDSDFMDLDTDQPFLRVQGAEPSLPEDPMGVGAAARRGPLKHRRRGEWRDIPIPLDMVPRINAHIDRYCAPNGRLFTSPFGCWLNTENWKPHFWEPVVDAVMAPLEVPADATAREQRLIHEANARRAVLQSAPFRNLRHAGITAWLLEGYSVTVVAQMAGNSLEVISNNYAGVIRELQRPKPTQKPAAIVAPAAPVDLSSLSEADLEVVLAELLRRKASRGTAA
jgi:hypothetical protein